MVNKSFRIGVFGSAANATADAKKLAAEIGEEIAINKCVLINGGCLGLPDIAARAANQAGGNTIGYSPARNVNEHRDKYSCPVDIYTKLVFVSEDFEFSENVEVSRKYRNVISCAKCDAGVIIGGRIGTLNEFTNLFDMQKVIGIVQGSGGIADYLPEILKIANKDSKSVIIIDRDPKTLIKKVIDKLKEAKFG